MAARRWQAHDQREQCHIPLCYAPAGELRPHYVPEGGAALTIERFENVAASEPERPCLVFNGVTLSYGEVNARANRLARTLVELGVSRDVGVGLMMDRSFELVIAMLAAMKVGLRLSRLSIRDQTLPDAAALQAPSCSS